MPDPRRDAVTIDVDVARKQHSSAAFAVVPAAAIADWALGGTTTVEGTIAGVPLGRRSLKRWDDEQWLVELPGPLLARASLAVGDHARLVLRPASQALPDELVELLDADAGARARWDAMTDSQRRSVREDVWAAKSPSTRSKRADKALRPAPRRAAAAPSSLDSAPCPIRVRVEANELPGRTCGPYTAIRVGLQIGSEVVESVDADRATASWEIDVEVSVRGGETAFRGRGLHGPRTERFLYLVWCGRDGGGPEAMFRRAKLQLDGVRPGVLEAAVRSGVLVARLGLTDARGMPRCASVRPPDISWSAG